MMLTYTNPKSGTTREVEFESLPAESMQYLVNYGFTQCLSDSHAGITSKLFTDKSARAVAADAKMEARFTQLLTGEVPGSRAPANPARARAAEIVTKGGLVSDDEMAVMLAALEAHRAAKAA